MTNLSHELAMTGPPAELLALSIIISRFCGKEILLYFSLGSPVLQAVAAVNLQQQTFYETIVE
jgi:hypothetical protein